MINKIRNSLAEAFTVSKSQKARYPMSAISGRELGQPVPAKHSPTVREKLYKTPIVFMAVNTIAKEVSKVDWEIVPKRGILEEFGYGTREGKNSFVLSTKDYGRLKRKYVDAQSTEIKEETKQHIEKVFDLLQDPNENQESFTEIRKKLVTDLMIHDAAALEKITNGVDEVVEIYTAPAPYIRINHDKNGKLKNPAYIQYDPTMTHTKLAEWDKDELSYFMLNPISTSMYGISPIDVVAQIVATLINALNYNGTYFESAALPEGFFTLPGMTETQARRLMQKWEQEIKKKHHKVIFMPEGAKWHQFRFNNVEMQWLQGQKFYMEIVMAVFGVTKHELGFTEDINKATAEQQSFVFKNKSIIPTLNLLSEKINQDIIGKNGFGYNDVAFIFKNVDLADKETMDKIHDRAVRSGRMTINESREEAGRRPYDKFGDQPVIATSQGLVFLEQFSMKFDEYKEEQDWLQEQAEAEDIPIAEVRRRNSQAKSDNDNNTDNQPQTPPSAPKADEDPKVDEGKAIEVEGLSEVIEKIDKIVEDYESNSGTKTSQKRSKKVRTKRK